MNSVSVLRFHFFVSVIFAKFYFDFFFFAEVFVLESTESLNFAVRKCYAGVERHAKRVAERSEAQ